MNNRSMLMVLMSFCVCASGFTNTNNTSANYIIRDFVLALFPKGYGFHETIDCPVGTKAVSYKVKLRYPAKEILEYYDEELGNKGFIAFSDDSYGDRSWYHFVDATKKGKPEVNQMIASWVDRRKSMRVLLLLRYINGQKEEVDVTYQVQGYFELPNGQ